MAGEGGRQILLQSLAIGVSVVEDFSGVSVLLECSFVTGLMTVAADLVSAFGFEWQSEVTGFTTDLSRSSARCDFVGCGSMVVGVGIWDASFCC